MLPHLAPQLCAGAEAEGPLAAAVAVAALRVGHAAALAVHAVCAVPRIRTKKHEKNINVSMTLATRPFLNPTSGLQERTAKPSGAPHSRYRVEREGRKMGKNPCISQIKGV